MLTMNRSTPRIGYAQISTADQTLDILITALEVAGKAFFDMLGVFAELETNLRRERQAEGGAAAKR